MIHYEGIFFDEQTSNIMHSLECPMLEEVNDQLHCTFKYKPSGDRIFNDIVGQEFNICLVVMVMMVKIVDLK